MSHFKPVKVFDAETGEVIRDVYRYPDDGTWVERWVPSLHPEPDGSCRIPDDGGDWKVIREYRNIRVESEE